MKKNNIKNCMPHSFDLVTVGERGQVVIPAKARKSFGIKAGDKLVAITGGGHHALVLVKSDQMSHMIEETMKKIGKFREMLGGKK